MRTDRDITCRTKDNKRINSAINILVYVMSFLISGLGMLLIIKARGFYPFKDTTMFVMDMRDQYLEFYASLRYLFTGESSLFFNWSRSMGGNFLGLFAYYTASPLAFLTTMFSLEQMPLAIAVLSVVKIACCGLSFSMYAGYLWRRREGGSPWSQLLIIPLAVSYALMSYNMNYLLCLMWLDGVMFLPWVLLGVEKILDGRKGLHYLLALTCLFFCNYYTGYMVGLFTALYLLYRVFVLWNCSSRGAGTSLKFSFRDILQRLSRFTIATLLSIGLSAPLLLSVLQDLMTGKFDSASLQPDKIFYFQPLSKFLLQFQNGRYTDLNYGGMPSVYCGYLILACALLFFFLKKISLREKTGALFLLALLTLSFYLVPLDKVWHCFQFPNSFPYRYAFLFSFLLLYLALRALMEIPWEKLPSLMSRGRKPLFETLVLLFMLLTAWDLGTNGRDILFAVSGYFAYTPLEDYETFLDATAPLVNSIKEQDKGLYRVNQSYEFSKNDAMLLGYNGMTHYSSTYNRSVNILTKKLGLAQIYFWNSGFGSNPLLDSLFGVKYLLEDGPVPPVYAKLDETGLSWEEGSGTTASYENPLALDFIYSAPVTDLTPDLSNSSPYVNQNTFLNTIAGTTENYFTQYPCEALPQEHGFCYRFTADSDNPVYLYLLTDEYNMHFPEEVLVNGTAVGGYFTSETLCSLYLGCFTPGQEVTVEIPEQSMMPKQVFVAQLHMELLTPVLESLQDRGMTLESHRGANLQGSITVSEGEMIVTSIPYDKGWRVRLDGKAVDAVSFADTFLAIPAESGEHTISLSYVSPGFVSGMLLALAALLLSILYFHFPKTSSAQNQKRIP